MSFIFSQVNGSSIGQSAPDIGAGTFFGTAFDQGFRYSMLNSIYRMSEYRLTQDEDPFWNPRLKKEDANHFAQQQGVDLKFDDDPTQDEVNLLIRRHIEERDRAAILSAGATGIGRSAGQIGVQFLGSVLNPLDLPFMFLPIVGTATKAKNAGAFSNTVRRGIITREALEANGIALRGYTAAMIEGSVGQAITEIPLMFANMQDQTDYTAKMFFTNVALGAAFGAGVKTIQKVFQAVGRAHTRLTPETRENMGTGAMDDFIRGEPIDPARFVELDNGVIGSRASQSMDQLGYPVANNLDRQVDVTQHTANLKRMAEGSESVVYRDGKSVVKVSEEYSDKSQASYEKRVSDALERDEILGDGTMELDGYYLSPNGTKNPIFRQDFVEGRPATREEIQAHMESKGFTIDKAGKTTDTFIKVEDGQTYKVGDLDGDNVIVDKDGVAHIIDGDLVVTPKDPVDPEVIKEKRIEEERKAVEAFKAREEARAKHKEAELQREIDEVPVTPKAERAEFGETPTQKDIDRIEQEIKDLEDQLSAAGDEWLDDLARMEGNVSDVRPLLSGDADGVHLRREFDNATFELREGELFFTLNKTSSNIYRELWSDSGISFKIGDVSAPVYLDTWDFPGSVADAIGSMPEFQEAIGDSLFNKLLELYGLKRQGDNWVDGNGNEYSDFFSQHDGPNGDVMEGMMVNGELIQARIISDGKVGDKFSNWLKELKEERPEVFDSILPHIPFLVTDARAIKKFEEFSSIEMGDRSRVVQRLNEYEGDWNERRWRDIIDPEADKFKLVTGKAGDIADGIKMDLDDEMPIFDELFEIDPTLRDVKVMIDPLLHYGTGAHGMYRGKTDDILLDGRASPKTFFHELVHASAVRRWRQDLINNNVSQLPIARGAVYTERLLKYANKTDNPQLAGLVKAYLKAVEHHAAKVDPRITDYINTNIDAYYKKITEPHYGLYNFDEFIAEAVSNRQFQFYLNTIPGEGGKTLFREFIDKIKSFFGLPDKPGSLLDEVLEDYHKLISSGKRNPDEFLSGLKTIKSADVTTPMIERASTCVLNGQA